MCEDVGYVGGAVLPLICSWGFKTKGNRGLQNYENSPMPETLSQHCQMLVLDEEGGFQRTHSSVLEGDQHPPHLVIYLACQKGLPIIYVM